MREFLEAFPGDLTKERTGFPIHTTHESICVNRVRAFVVYVIHRQVASVLVAVNSCDVLAYIKRLFDVTLMI